jgi:hypothetical protein
MTDVNIRHDPESNTLTSSPRGNVLQTLDFTLLGITKQEVVARLNNTYAVKLEPGLPVANDGAFLRGTQQAVRESLGSIMRSLDRSIHDRC